MAQAAEKRAVCEKMVKRRLDGKLQGCMSALGAETCLEAWLPFGSAALMRRATHCESAGSLAVREVARVDTEASQLDHVIV